MVERLRGLGPAGRHGPDVPRPRAQPAPALLAVAPRRRAAARSCSTRSCRSSAGSRASCPATTGSRRPRTSPTRSSGRSRGGSGRATTSARPRATAPARAADPGRPVRPDLRRLRAREGARRAGSTSTTCSSRRSTCSRTMPRPRPRSAPASAGSASTSTRTRARSSSGCSSCGWASRRDVCVVGDDDQTIYTFTGASSAYLDDVRRAPSRRARRRR